MYVGIDEMPCAIRADTQNLLRLPCGELGRAAAVDQEDRRNAVLHGGGVQKNKCVVGMRSPRHLHHATADDLAGLAALRVDFRNGGQAPVHPEHDEIPVGDECRVVLVVSRL